MDRIDNIAQVRVKGQANMLRTPALLATTMRMISNIVDEATKATKEIRLKNFCLFGSLSPTKVSPNNMCNFLLNIVQQWLYFLPFSYFQVQIFVSDSSIDGILFIANQFITSFFIFAPRKFFYHNSRNRGIKTREEEQK